MTTPNGRKQVVAMFGSPGKPGTGKLDQDWYKANIVTIALPHGMKMVQSWDKAPVTKIEVHRLLADNLSAVLQDIWDWDRATIKATLGYNEDTAFYDRKTNELLVAQGLNSFGGTFNFRAIRGDAGLSMHSFGIAIDLDPEGNALGSVKGRMPVSVVKIFEKHGWFWGGNFQHRKDPMHFQFATGC